MNDMKQTQEREEVKELKGENNLIGQKFTFSLYRKNIHFSSDSWHFTLLDDGWYIENAGGVFEVKIEGKCEPTGHPYLYNILDKTKTEYPANLDKYLDSIWKSSINNKFNYGELYERLRELIEWIIAVEKHKPF